MAQPPNEDNESVVEAIGDDITDDEELAESAGESSETAAAQEEKEKVQKYRKAITDAFDKYYQPGIDRFDFMLEELREIGLHYGIPAKNAPDIAYYYRSRHPLPDNIRATGNWALENAGTGVYAFLRLQGDPHFHPNIDEYDAVPIFSDSPENVPGQELAGSVNASAMGA